MVVKAVAAVAALAVTAVGTAKTIQSQNKMVKQQRKAQQFERQKQDLQSMRQKLEVVRATRTARAQAQQVAENQGVADSSAAQGGQASIMSQGASNLSFLDQYGFLSDQAGAALQKAMKYQGQASMWSSITEAAGKAYQMTGGVSTGGGATGPTPPSAASLTGGSGDAGWWVGHPGTLGN